MPPPTLGGGPLPWAPPPTGAPVTPAQPPEGQPPLSDTLEHMLRPQGLFQNRMPAPAEWQQPYPPPPGGYPPGGQYPPGNPYQQGGGYPQPGQYPATGGYQQPAPPWPQGPTGALPAAPAGPAQPGYPGGQYPQGGGYQDPYGNGQYQGGQYGQDQFPPGQFPPGGSRLLGRLPGNRRLIPVAVAAGIAVIVVVALVLSSKAGSAPGSAGGTTAGGTPSTSSSAGTTALTQHQAATALAGLLAQSGTDHSDVNAAVTSVEGCKTLTADAQTFNRAATNRRTLLSKLAQLPGRSALSSQMLADLTSGWQASATVDGDLARWAAAEAGHCKKNDLKNPNYVASLPDDSQATNGKTEFVGLWNGLARKYGLAVYQPSQI